MDRHAFRIAVQNYGTASQLGLSRRIQAGFMMEWELSSRSGGWPRSAATILDLFWVGDGVREGEGGRCAGCLVVLGSFPVF